MYVDSDTGAFAYIEANESSAYRQVAGIHQFFTQASSATVTLSEKMRLTSAGRLGIGSSDPQTKFVVAQYRRRYRYRIFYGRPSKFYTML